jgi:hypothetical protein
MRREKDTCLTFEEKCREFQDQMAQIAESEPNILLQQNEHMLKSCVLFSNGGNYDEKEVEWYSEQMKEINEMVEKTKVERDEKMKEIVEEMALLMKEPNENFEKDYQGSIQQLSAKEGLGKVYGQPRRLAQERLRAEMTKCESA